MTDTAGERRRDRVDRPAVHLTLYVAEPHRANRRSKANQVLRRAAELGLSGGTMIAAFEGFGRRHSHEPTFRHGPGETPLVLSFVDRPERIDALLAEVDIMLPDVVAVTEQVRATRYIRPHQH